MRRDELEHRVIKALQTNLMNENLCEKFCAEYVSHMNALRKEHNAARAKFQSELEKIKRDNDRLVQAILDGVPADTLKDKAEYYLTRKAELEELIANSVEAPVVFHPSMAKRYHDEIQNLIDSLNNEDHREEATGLIRQLIDKVIITPTEDKKYYVVDLIGDLAGILACSTKNENSFLVSGGVDFLTALNAKQSDKQDMLVAGEGNRQNLLPINNDNNVGQDMLVAGAGFGVFLPFCVGLCPP